MAIHVDEAALTELRDALETAGKDYIDNLRALDNVMNEIRSGNIKGDPATDLLNKYEAKQETFNNLRETIIKAAEYMGDQTLAFTNMISDLSSGMR